MTVVPCAVYTRKSCEEGLEQGFNSLDAQREACEAFILSQRTQHWKAVGCYDDGGFSGGNVERPALQRLLNDIAARRVRIVVVYKVDRLTRSLADFAKLVELFDAHGVSFVSVTQQFNTTSSMGRLTLNVLLSFAQFEREVTGERIRDKIAASKRKGMWMGGFAPLGYRPHERSLAVDEPQAARVREIFRLYLALGCVRRLKAELDRRGWTTPQRQGRRLGGGRPFSRGHLYRILANAVYIGQIAHKGQTYPGQHQAIVEDDLWREVQARLAANAQQYTLRSDAAQPSLLAGLAFDGEGRRLRPSHTKKGARRYRYYFRPTCEVGGADSNADRRGAALRIPAPALEGTVVAALHRFLRDDARLLAAMVEIDAAVARARITAARAMADQWEAMASTQRAALLKRLVSRVVVGAESIEISVRTAALCVTDGPIEDDPSVSIAVPVELRRCGAAVRLIVRGSDEGKAPGPDPRLIALLTKAQRWFTALSSGTSPSVLSIAQEHGAPSSDVTQVIYLAFLAPDVVQRIVRGEQSVGLGTKRLLGLAPLPLDWADQRRVLGFAA
jgi:site-specific DNA recombinase